MTVKLDGETIQTWVKRHKQVTGITPSFLELKMAPFYNVIMPKCTNTERYLWCVENFGIDGFYEFMSSDYKSHVKMWIFNSDMDATMFKLRWSDDGVMKNNEPLLPCGL